MGLKDSVYYNYSFRDKKGKTLFLIFIKNNINLRDIPFYLLKLS
jgi:hypothetical protein